MISGTQKSSILGVWTAPWAPETTPKGGARRAPPFGVVCGPPGAVQTPKINNVWVPEKEIFMVILIRSWGLCFRVGNRASGTDFGPILIGQARFPARTRYCVPADVYLSAACWELLEPSLEPAVILKQGQCYSPLHRSKFNG